MGELEIKIGELLRLERERQGKKLSVIAENLRISETNLRAVETGDVSAVPSEVYFRLFAKSYAEAIGVDYSATMEAIKEDMAQHAEDSHRARRGKLTSGEEAEAAEEDVAEEPAVEKKTVPWKVIGIVGALVVVLLGAYAAFNIFPVQYGSEQRIEAAPVNPAYASYNWHTPAYKAPDSLRLVLRPRGASWARVVTDGDTVVFRTLVPGHVYYAAAKYRIEMYVALPRVVPMELDRQPFSPIDPETGHNPRVIITQANLDSILTAARQSPPVTTSAVTTRPVAPPSTTATGNQNSADSTESGENEL